MSDEIKVYTSQLMTGRMCDEMVQEAEMLRRVLGNYGFTALNPVIEEKVQPVHEPLALGDPSLLARYWKRDKEMIRDADIVLDYQTMNVSDGSNKEIAYARWCLWKPVVRVWRGPGGAISRLEDDVVAPCLFDAILEIQTRWGTYEKLRRWRNDMLDRCWAKWGNYQINMSNRYGLIPFDAYIGCEVAD